MIHVFDIISKIETRQEVLNKQALLDKPVDIFLTGVGSIANASSKQLAFLSKDKFAPLLTRCKAGAVIVTVDKLDLLPEECTAIVVQSPYLAYASASQLFRKRQVSKLQKPLIHPTAVIADSAQLGKNVSIGAYSVIGENVVIGDECHIESHVCIEEDSSLGQSCVVKPQAVIATDSHLGNHVIIHAGASIGSDGFGFAPTENPSEAVNGLAGWEPIAQLGRVIIGNHVRIGANTSIDRGAVDDTVIADNVIIDNLVQIAHNVRIGAGTAIAAKVGIAGSTTIGKRCIIGGAVGITGHIEITDDVTLTGMSMVTKSISKPGVYSSGTSAMPANEWRRAAVRFRQMGKK